MRAGADTYPDKRSAARVLSLIEAQMITRDWTDPQQAKITLQIYAGKWIERAAELAPDDG
jgi:hypothetical protein